MAREEEQTLLKDDARTACEYNFTCCHAAGIVAICLLLLLSGGSFIIQLFQLTDFCYASYPEGNCVVEHLNNTCQITIVAINTTCYSKCSTTNGSHPCFYIDSDDICQNGLYSFSSNPCPIYSGAIGVILMLASFVMIIIMLLEWSCFIPSIKRIISHKQ